MVKILRGALVCSAIFACGGAFAFELSSADFNPGGTIASQQIFQGMGCVGGNVSPQLSWKDVPTGTKSFALLVHDPDAPTGGAGWWHWVVYNIPADARSLPEGAGSTDGKGLPAGAMQQKTDFGSAGYGGPCPPAGDKPHHYRFTLYALKVDKLDVPAQASASTVGFMANAKAIDKATLTGRYGRQ